MTMELILMMEQFHQLKHRFGVLERAQGFGLQVSVWCYTRINGTWICGRQVIVRLGWHSLLLYAI